MPEQSFPIVLVGSALLAALATVVLWPRRRALSGLTATLALVIAAVGSYSYFVEPNWLQVSRTTVLSDKIASPLRIALLADIQFKDFGAYEEGALAATMAEDPDLILFAGDYVQTTPANYTSQMNLFREALVNQGVSTPLGVFAVEGDAEEPNWSEIFAGLPVKAMGSGTEVVREDVSLTALSLAESADPATKVEGQRGFHIVLGHRPDFVLGQGSGNLRLAGHIHGGQVQIPFFGPPITLSQVPRSWSAGLTQVSPGQQLYVSRGIGMERGKAPPIRFLARPEIAIIDVRQPD